MLDMNMGANFYGVHFYIFFRWRSQLPPRVAGVARRRRGRVPLEACVERALLLRLLPPCLVSLACAVEGVTAAWLSCFSGSNVMISSYYG